MNVPQAGPDPNRRPYALSRVTDDANLVESLRRVAIAGHDQLEHCRAASVTVIAGGRPTTMGSTDEVAERLDDAQYAADDGPCLAAARHEKSVRIDTVASESRWPEFRRVALELEVSCSLSVPLMMEDPDTFGGLNIYGDLDGGFSRHDEELAEAFAAHAAIVVANVVAYWTVLDLSVNLAAAMEHRGVIEQAKGILMATNGCSPDEAFVRLRQRSQAENRKLRDIAVAIVDDVQGRN